MTQSEHQPAINPCCNWECMCRQPFHSTPVLLDMPSQCFPTGSLVCCCPHSPQGKDLTAALVADFGGHFTSELVRAFGTPLTSKIVLGMGADFTGDLVRVVSAGCHLYSSGF